MKKDSDYFENRNKLWYSSTQIETQLKRIDEMSRNDPLKNTHKKTRDNQQIPLVTTESKALRDIRETKKI